MNPVYTWTNDAPASILSNASCAVWIPPTPIIGNAPLDFVCKYNFFQKLNFELKPIEEKRWEKDPNLSTGVGHQISIRLNDQGLSMFHVKKSLISHGDVESKLFPELRKKEKLIAKF